MENKEWKLQIELLLPTKMHKMTIFIKASKTVYIPEK